MSTTESIGHTYQVHHPACADHHGDGPKRWQPYQARRPDPRASQSLSDLLGVAPAGASPLQSLMIAIKHRGGVCRREARQQKTRANSLRIVVTR